MLPEQYDVKMDRRAEELASDSPIEQVNNTTKPDKTKVHTVYKTRAGDKVPSVTTVIGILNKPALLEWAYRCGCEGTDYKAYRDNTAGVGTLAHYMILCHLKNETTDTSMYSPQDVDKAENSFIKYLDWEKEHKIEPLLTESPLVSETFKYGGTVDFYGLVDGVPSIVDFKTGKAIYSEYFYQVAAYRQLLIECALAKPENARILRIGRDEIEGFEERTIPNLDTQWLIFLKCLEIYSLQKLAKKES